jgi:hypothetical protein
VADGNGRLAWNFQKGVILRNEAKLRKGENWLKARQLLVLVGEYGSGHPGKLLQNEPKFMGTNAIFAPNGVEIGSIEAK